MWLLSKISEFITGLKPKSDKHPLDYVDRKMQEMNAPYKIEPAAPPVHVAPAAVTATNLHPTEKEAIMPKTSAPAVEAPAAEPPKKTRAKKDPAPKAVAPKAVAPKAVAKKAAAKPKKPTAKKTTD